MEHKEIRAVVEDAKAAYEVLKGQFMADGNYWQLGCCFDTMTDALRVLGPSTDADLAADALTKYRATKGAWYDDYAWWSIACAKAWDPEFAAVFGKYTDDFTAIAADCWSYIDVGLGDQVHNGAPQVYEDRDNLAFFRNRPVVPAYYAAPRFDHGRGSGLHGVWQKDMFANERKAPNWFGPVEFDPNPSIPADTRLGPYQLTVVNALYLLNAARFEQARSANPSVPDCTTQLADEYGFLRAWMGLDPQLPIAQNETLLHGFVDGSAVILERPGTYAFLDGVFPKVENSDEVTSWAGDQGMMINGLAACLQLDPANTEIALVLRSLLMGYPRHLVDTEGELYPWFPITGNKLPGWDESDYESGIGVYMRGVLQAARIADGPVAGLVRAGEFQAFLAKAVTWAATAPTGDMFASLNVLATLLAGIELLRP